MNIRKDLQGKASSAVHQAIKKGKLIRPGQCELCGKTAKTSKPNICHLAFKIFAHHWAGYDSENWLNIWWVCQSCNVRLGNRHDGTMNKQQAKKFIRNWSPDQRWEGEQNTCKGMCKNGHQCKKIISSHEYCRHHRKDNEPISALAYEIEHNNIQTILLDRGLSISDLQRMITQNGQNCSYPTLHQLAGPGAGPVADSIQIGTIDKIAGALGVKISDLIEDGI